MIAVTILRRKGEPVGFLSSGHAGYADYGSDIVCSAVSALTQTCCIGLAEVLRIRADITVSEETGICCRIGAGNSAEQTDRAALLIQTMEAGLRSIGEAYPDTLKIVYREV